MSLWAQTNPSAPSVGTPPSNAPLQMGQGQRSPGGMALGSDPSQQTGLPHDVRTLVPYETPWYIYAGWVGLGIILSIIGWWLLKRLQDYQSKKSQQSPTIDPWVSLKTRLQSLAPGTPFDHENQVEYFYQLSLLLREGIEYRTKIRATDMTLQELKVRLANKLPLRNESSHDLFSFLERADLIKFAEQPADLQEAQDSKRNILMWTEQLQPQKQVLDQSKTAYTGSKTVEPAEQRPQQEGGANGIR